jgi:predicted tellurium resistance membrane protein TerC
VQLASAGMRPSTVRVGVFVLAIVVALSVAEVASGRFEDFTQEHALLSTFLTEAVLLVGVYLVIDEIIDAGMRAGGATSCRWVYVRCPRELWARRRSSGEPSTSWQARPR